MTPAVNDALDLDWQLRVLEWMGSTCLHHPTPEDAFSAWVDEAAEADDEYLLWAFGAWKVVHNLAAYELEQMLSSVKQFRLKRTAEHPPS